MLPECGLTPLPGSFFFKIPQLYDDKALQSWRWALPLKVFPFWNMEGQTTGTEDQVRPCLDRKRICLHKGRLHLHAPGQHHRLAQKIRWRKRSTSYPYNLFSQPAWIRILLFPGSRTAKRDYNTTRMSHWIAFVPIINAGSITQLPLYRYGSIQGQFFIIVYKL